MAATIFMVAIIPFNAFSPHADVIYSPQTLYCKAIIQAESTVPFLGWSHTNHGRLVDVTTPIFKPMRCYVLWFT
jgi:hypothetical protein